MTSPEYSGGGFSRPFSMGRESADSDEAVAVTIAFVQVS
jgi:hypothetical protein